MHWTRKRTSFAGAVLFVGLASAVLPTATAGAAKGPSATVKPSTKLVIGSTVKVSAKGFAANDQLAIVECNAKAASSDTNACNETVGSAPGDVDFPVTANSKGVLSPTAYTVTTGTIGDGTCNPGQTCYITVSEPSATGLHALAKIVFSKTAGGTVSCTSLGATVTFKPPLVPHGTSAEKSTIKPITLGGCVSNSTSVTVTKVTATITVVGTNSCTSFASNVSSDSLSLVVKWSGLSPTTVKFPAGTISVNSTDSGFVASGGKATGSYAMKSATFSANLSTGSQSQLVSCIGGSGTVSSIQIATGSATL